MSRLQVNGLLAAAALLVSVIANSAEDEQPFKLDKREFEKKYKVIALAPPESDPYLQVSEGVKKLVEQEVTARLKKRGYTVMPSSVLGGIRAEMTAQVGQPDTAKQAAVREHAFRELWFRHQVDAVALMRIRVFSVPAENDKVEWDGASQSIEHTGGREEYKANVSVSSVVVAIYDPKDAPLYVSYGGIEALMSRQGEQLLPLPVEQLLRDEKKIRKAAQTAVEAL